MVSNQRSIYESIQKVVGSSNRGFISLDPERQPRINTQPAKAGTPLARSQAQAVPASTGSHGRR